MTNQLAELKEQIEKIVLDSIDAADGGDMLLDVKEAATAAMLALIQAYGDERERLGFTKGEKYGRLNEHHVIGHDILDNEDLAALRPITIRRLKARNSELQSTNPPKEKQDDPDK